MNAKKIIFPFFVALSIIFPMYILGDKKEPIKPMIIKIRNTDEVISYEQMNKINPKTILYMDVFTDSIIITLKSHKPIPRYAPLRNNRKRHDKTK